MKRVGFTGDICPAKNAKKRYNVTILELNPVVNRDDEVVVIDHCRRRESSTVSDVNDALQSSCSECLCIPYTDRHRV